MSLYVATGKQPERRATVLAHISTHGPRTEYELYEELGMSRGTTHHALKKLAEIGLLKPVPRRKEGAARRAIQFHLTTLGVLTALTMGRALKRLQKIVEVWPEVCPRILLNWKQLSNDLGSGYFRKRVLMVTYTLLSGQPLPGYEFKFRETSTGLQMEPIDYADRFATVFLNPSLVEGGQQEEERLIKAVCKVPELRTELSEKLRVFEGNHRSLLDMVKHLQHVVEVELAQTSAV